MLVLMVMSAQMPWPSIRQHKLVRATQIQGYHVLALVVIIFMTLPGLRLKGMPPLTQRYQDLQTRLPLSSSTFQTCARMHSKHKLGHTNPKTG